MEKSTLRTLAKAKGAKVEIIDHACDWMAFPSEKSLLEFRQHVPYLTNYSGRVRDHYNLVVFYNELKEASHAQT